MALSVHLSSVPNINYAATLEFRGDLVAVLQFPGPGRLITQRFDLLMPVLEQLQIGFRVDGQLLNIRMQKVPTNSAVSLMALPDKIFLGGVYHPEAKADCIVMCENGKSEKNCADCEVGGIKVRVWC